MVDRVAAHRPRRGRGPRSAQLEHARGEQAVDRPAQALLLGAELAELATAVDAAQELRVGRVDREILEAVEGALAVGEVAARVAREVAVDALEREALAHAVQDQARGAAAEPERVRALDPRAALEAERAARPREDLEELLVGLRAQRIGHLLFGERAHRHEDLAVAHAALLRLAGATASSTSRETRPAAQQVVPERLAHQVRAHRDRIAVAQLDPLALLLVREVERARRAQPVQVVEQRGERDALEIARRAAALARRRLARLAGTSALGARDAARDHLEQPLERDRLREQVERLELVRRAARRSAVGVAGQHHDGQVAHLAVALAQLAEHLESVAARQLQVEQHQVGQMLADDRERLGAVVAGADRVAFVGERFRDDLTQVPVVVDVEDAGGHPGDSSCRSE